VMQIHCLILPSIAHKVEKHSCKNNACYSAVSYGRLMQQACRSVTLASPLISFHQMQLQQQEQSGNFPVNVIFVF
jgi:hypothetical protein